MTESDIERLEGKEKTAEKNKKELEKDIKRIKDNLFHTEKNKTDNYFIRYIRTDEIHTQF